MSKRLVDISDDGVVEFFHEDPMTGQVTVQKWQDVEPHLDANKRAQAAGDGFSPSRELREIADIPMGVVLLWKQMYGIDLIAGGREAMIAAKKLLRSSEWAHLRTSPGNI